MKKEYIIERQGKAMVLYAGLLDEAHQQGLKSITTELIQIPTEANNRVAICRSVVVMARDGVEHTFTGIGDAAPNNVAPPMVTALIRMAETRSKARALRDAVNVGSVAAEEVGDNETGMEAAVPAPVARRQMQARTPAAPARDPATSPITEGQKTAIVNTCKRLGHDVAQLVKTRYDLTLDALTEAQAGELIRELNQRPQRAASGQAASEKC